MVEEGRAPTPPFHLPLRARTPAPSETSMEAQDEPTDEGAEPEQINVYSPEVEALTAQAESLHIPTDKTMATQTQTQTQVQEEPPYLCINPITGHVMDVDPQDAPAIYRALGSDHADPPDALHLPKSHDGNLTSPEGEAPRGRPQEEEEGEDNRCMRPDHHSVEEEEEEEPSHFPGKHLPMLLKNSWETHLLSLQETKQRWTPSSHNGSYTAA